MDRKNASLASALDATSSLKVKRQPQLRSRRCRSYLVRFGDPLEHLFNPCLMRQVRVHLFLSVTHASNTAVKPLKTYHEKNTQRQLNFIHVCRGVSGRGVYDRRRHVLLGTQAVGLDANNEACVLFSRGVRFEFVPRELPQKACQVDVS